MKSFTKQSFLGGKPPRCLTERFIVQRQAIPFPKHRFCNHCIFNSLLNLGGRLLIWSGIPILCRREVKVHKARRESFPQDFEMITCDYLTSAMIRTRIGVNIHAPGIWCLRTGTSCCRLSGLRTGSFGGKRCLFLQKSISPEISS